MTRLCLNDRISRLVMSGLLLVAVICRAPRSSRAAENSESDEQTVSEQPQAPPEETPPEGGELSAESSSRRMAHTRPPAPSPSAIKKEDLLKLDRKMDDMLQNQQAILKKFDAVMEELRIIKVRATLRSSS